MSDISVIDALENGHRGPAILLYTKKNKGLGSFAFGVGLAPKNSQHLLSPYCVPGTRARDLGNLGI